MKNYEPVIGLEIHAELKTLTKMFCNSKNDPEEKRPNFNICPICMGHPGTLPVINKEAVKQVLRVGASIGGELADFTEFDRKNYFYPDIPKGYQISQYKYPLVKGGILSGVSITRVHLEEDTARSSHEDTDYSLVDFNRAGLPLMELVTEPVIKTAEEAGRFARELQLLLRYLGASFANMEKGEMRVEANVSVSDTVKDGKPVLGTKVEVKNLNSFRSVEKAIAYEISRQTDLLESGEKVIQETRGWDEAKQKTYSQRIKEDSHDYRYFPDPDLPKLKLSEISEFASPNLSLPELPWIKRERYSKEFGIVGDNLEIFIENLNIANFFESVASILKDSKDIILAVNYITSDLVGLAKSKSDIDNEFASLKFSPENFADLVKMIKNNVLSSRGAKDTLALMYLEGGEPEVIAKEKGLIQQNDAGELKKVVQAILDSNAKVVSDYKNGKDSALQFLVGQGMKVTKGSANPEMLKSVIQSIIGR